MCARAAWLLVLTAGLARAGPLDATLDRVHPWADRQAVRGLLADVPDRGPVGDAWRRLVTILLLEAPAVTPRAGETAGGWAQRLTAEVAPRLVLDGRDRGLVALVTTLQEALPGTLLESELRLAAGLAAARGEWPEAVAWLEPLAAERPAAAAGLLAAYRTAGRLDDAVRLLGQVRPAEGWLQAELTALGRARDAGLALDLRIRSRRGLEVAHHGLHGPASPLGPWLVVEVANHSDRAARLSVLSQVAGVTEEARNDVTVPPATTLSISQTPVLRADLTVTGERPAALRVRVDLDLPAGAQTLLDTTAPVAVSGSPALSPEAAPELLVALARTAPDEAGQGESLPTALPAEAANRAEATLALLRALRDQARPIWLLASGGRTVVGLLPSERWGLVRLLDEVGGPRRVQAAVLAHEPSRRRGFQPTAARGAIQLDPNRDGLALKPAQALGAGILPADPEQWLSGSVPLFVATPEGPSVWLDAPTLRDLGLPAALAAGYEVAVPALWQALAATDASVARGYARDALREVLEQGQVLETILEGRYGRRLSQLRGWSFFGDDQPAAGKADRELTDRERQAADAVLARLDELWADQDRLHRVIWRLELLTDDDERLRVLAAPGGDTRLLAVTAPRPSEQ